jgi:predicted AlkP superfamily phosphohydrolase/phosphomutase
VYRRIDEAVGRIIASAGSDAEVIIFSPHGMRANFSATPLAEDLIARLNDLLLAQRRSRKSSIARCLDWLLDRARPGVHRSLFFVVPYNELGLAIRLNLKGREPAGLVAPNEVSVVKQAIRDCLLDLRDAQTGERVVEQVHDFAGNDSNSTTQTLPDLLAVWRNSTPRKELVSSLLGKASEHAGHLRPGNHDADGFALVSGRRAELVRCDQAERKGRHAPNCIPSGSGQLKVEQT